MAKRRFWLQVAALLANMMVFSNGMTALAQGDLEIIDTGTHGADGEDRDKATEENPVGDHGGNGQPGDPGPDLNEVVAMPYDNVTVISVGGNGGDGGNGGGIPADDIV